MPPGRWCTHTTDGALEGVAAAPHNGRVGMNPFRAQKRRPGDYVMVAAALVVCIGLVFWAFKGF